MTATHTPILPRPAAPRRMSGMVELDQRIANGIEVRLLWHPEHGDVAVAVDDARTDERFMIRVDPACALEAFRHPFAFRG